MKVRPILFSAPMIRALLAGTKTQTRRVVKAPRCATLHGRSSLPDQHFADGTDREHGEYLHWFYGGGDLGRDACAERVWCPYGEIGDRLWVRETWAAADTMYQGHAVDPPRTIAYLADKSARFFGAAPRAGTPGPRAVPAYDLASWNWEALAKRPSIFMPRWASRITLEITDVRCERLQWISLADIRDEGVSAPSGAELDAEATRVAWERGWDAINGKRAPWASNPWVWALTVRRVP